MKISESLFKKEPKKSSADNNIIKSFISPGAEVDSALFRSIGSVAINGLFNGRLEIGKDMELLPEGVINGDVSTNNAIVWGSIKGIINCGGFLEIEQTASIEGDITASSVRIEHGAIIKGMITIKPTQIISSGNSFSEHTQL